METVKPSPAKKVKSVKEGNTFPIQSMAEKHQKKMHNNKKDNKAKEQMFGVEDKVLNDLVTVAKGMSKKKDEQVVKPQAMLAGKKSHENNALEHSFNQSMSEMNDILPTKKMRKSHTKQSNIGMKKAVQDTILRLNKLRDHGIV